MAENVLELTDVNFDEEVINSDVPVLVDFWAQWCQPCIRLGPTIEKIAAEYAGKAKVGKVDTDSNFKISKKYQIASIPTVIVFKGGQIVQKFVGVRNEADYKAALDQK